MQEIVLTEVAPGVMGTEADAGAIEVKRQRRLHVFAVVVGTLGMVLGCALMAAPFVWLVAR